MGSNWGILHGDPSEGYTRGSFRGSLHEILCRCLSFGVSPRCFSGSFQGSFTGLSLGVRCEPPSLFFCFTAIFWLETTVNALL